MQSILQLDPSLGVMAPLRSLTLRRGAAARAAQPLCGAQGAAAPRGVGLRALLGDAVGAVRQPRPAGVCGEPVWGGGGGAAAPRGAAAGAGRVVVDLVRLPPCIACQQGCCENACAVSVSCVSDRNSHRTPVQSIYSR